MYLFLVLPQFLALAASATVAAAALAYVVHRRRRAAAPVPTRAERRDPPFRATGTDG
jgi:hypothetical protein